MNYRNFLTSLARQGHLKKVEPSQEIASSFIIKSQNCMQVAKLAFDAGIYENAVSEAYFSMYNTLTSLLFTCGIKCENHAAAAVLLQELFKLYELHELFSQFKKERIDSQYYVVEQHMKKIHKEECGHLLSTAQRFNLLLRAYSRKLSKQEIAKIQNDFEVLLN